VTRAGGRPSCAEWRRKVWALLPVAAPVFSWWFSKLGEVAPPPYRIAPDPTDPASMTVTPPPMSPMERGAPRATRAAPRAATAAVSLPPLPVGPAVDGESRYVGAAVGGSTPPSSVEVGGDAAAVCHRPVAAAAGALTARPRSLPTAGRRVARGWTCVPGVGGSHSHEAPLHLA